MESIRAIRSQAFSSSSTGLSCSARASSSRFRTSHSAEISSMLLPASSTNVSVAARVQSSKLNLRCASRFDVSCAPGPYPPLATRIVRIAAPRGSFRGSTCHQKGVELQF
jgi:hypothetical protein